MSKDTEQVWTVVSMLEWATTFFSEKKVDSPRMSIEWLIADVLDIQRLDIYLQYDRPFSQQELDKLRPLIRRRANHEPLQYITGRTDFMGIPINVNKSVLIPRQETEQLIEIILKTSRFSKTQNCDVLDIGTGSGCIPIAIKSFNPEWNCTGIDISDEALSVAVKNAELNQLNINLFHCDLTKMDSNKAVADSDWDIIVSNPPYITFEEKESLDPQVVNHEPALALFDKDPLSLYEVIASFAASKNAELYLECNDKLTSNIISMIDQYYIDSKIVSDLDGNPRFIVALNSSK